MRRRKITIAVAGLLIGLAGCAERPSPPAAPLVLDYTRYGDIVLAVGSISVERAAPIQDDPDAARFVALRPTLSDAAWRWGHDRLRAAGGRGEAVMTITQASIHRTKLNTDQGVEAWFKRQQGEKWLGQLAIEIKVFNGADRFSGVARARVIRATTLPEQPSVSEVENAYRRMLLGLIDDLNVKMEAGIRDNLAPVLMNIPEPAILSDTPDVDR